MDLLRQLLKQGYQLTVEGDKLRVEHPTRRYMSMRLAWEIRKHKAELIALLTGATPATSGGPPDNRVGSPKPADIKAKSRALFVVLRARGRGVWIRPDYVPPLAVLGRLKR